MEKYTGTVKTYSAQKGFGFIECEQVVGDVYFQTRDLPAVLQGRDLQLQGCMAHFELQHTPDGKPRGKNVIVEGAEELAEAAPQAGVAMFGAAVNLAAPISWAGGNASEEMVTGEVKSFNDMKGFGFLSSPQLEGDVYFQKKDVPPQLQGVPLNGMQAAFALHTTPDGKFQARNIQFNVSQATPAVKGGGKGGKGWMLGAPAGFGGGFGPAPQKGGWGGGGVAAWGGGAAGGAFCGGGGAAFAGGKGGGAGMAAQAGGLADEATVLGAIKSIDPEKGYGFITVPGLGQDVYFKPETLLEAGMNVSFTLKWTRDGKPQGRDIVPALSGGEVLVGTVKSFSEKNGYGFLSTEESAQDIYFNSRSLPAEMQALAGSDLTGMTLSFSVQLKPDGKPQAQDLAEVSGTPMPRGMKRPAEWGAGNSSAIMPMKAAKGAPMPRGSAAGMWGNGGKGDNAGNWGAGAMGCQGGAGMVEPAGSATGFIKSFNTMKGFGFIESAEVEGDIYFKSTMLPPHLQASPLQGNSVTFELRYTPDGKPQAGNLVVDE